jgi:hypothetical protein
MQMRRKTYLHFMSAWRLLRNAISPHHGHGPTEASPSLIYAAVILAFLLAILELDAHRGELQALGLRGSDYPAQDAFLSP